MAVAAQPVTANEALERLGLTGDRILRLAHRIANDELARHGARLGNRYEDLVSCLVEVALRAALHYDPARSGNGYKPESYLCDVMAHRLVDFYRRKSEGFGDRRYGNDGRISLTGDTIEADPDVDFEGLISEHRLQQWQHAATRVELPISEWIVITLDKAARQIERTSAT